MKDKKWELIAKAHQEYPKGTIIICAGKLIELTGKYVFADDNAIVDENNALVYYANITPQWAAIMTEKPNRLRVLMDLLANYAIIQEDCVSFYVRDEVKWILKKKEIEAVIKAYQSLQ